MGRTIALYGETGSGKTPQIGELAKARFKRDRKITVIKTQDLGGYDSILPLVKLGIVRIDAIKQTDDPWEWINGSVEGEGLDESVGVVAYESGSSMSEALLSNCAKLSAAGEDIGGRPAPKFIINKRSKTPLRIGTNVDSHYMVVQSFMLDAIWRSTWLAAADRDVVWSFSLYRGENAQADPILGPKLAGKALTAAIPKWFNYCFRLEAVAVEGGPARHLLYIQPQSDKVGIATSYGNARYPLDATTPLPAIIEPASVNEAFRLIEQGQVEAEENLRREMGL